MNKKRIVSDTFAKLWKFMYTNNLTWDMGQMSIVSMKEIPR